MEQQTAEDRPCVNPWEDQRKAALEHYREVSTRCSHWSSFVENAIKSYQPEEYKAQPVVDTRKEAELLKERFIDNCHTGYFKNSSEMFDWLTSEGNVCVVNYDILLRENEELKKELSTQKEREDKGLRWRKATELKKIDWPTCIKYDGGGAPFYITVYSMEELNVHITEHNPISQIEWLEETPPQPKE